MMNSAQRMCARCVLPDSFPGISFDETGVCSECREHERRWAGWELELPKRKKILEQLCEDARRRHREFDALVPLSGGKDSSYVLYMAVKELGLRCLAFTLDNGYLSKHARANIERGCRLLGVEHIYYCMDPVFMNKLFALFLRKTGDFCAVCTRAISMATERIADMYDIPLILHGSSARTELVLSREMFEWGPVSYMRNVLRGEPLAADSGRLLCKPSIRRRIGYRIFRWEAGTRIRLYGSIKLPAYIDWEYDTMYRTISEKMGWQAPPGDMEHMDCVIHPVTTYLHNRRFPGLEIERLTVSKLIMVGQLSRQEALRRLREGAEEQCPQSIMSMFLDNLGMSREEFDRYVDMGPRHLQFQAS